MASLGLISQVTKSIQLNTGKGDALLSLLSFCHLNSIKKGRVECECWQCMLMVKTQCFKAYKVLSTSETALNPRNTLKSRHCRDHPHCPAREERYRKVSQHPKCHTVQDIWPRNHCPTALTTWQSFIIDVTRLRHADGGADFVATGGDLSSSVIWCKMYLFTCL